MSFLIKLAVPPENVSVLQGENGSALLNGNVLLGSVASKVAPEAVKVIEPERVAELPQLSVTDIPPHWIV